MDHFTRLKCDLSLPVTGRHKDINKQPGKQELLKLAMLVTEMSVDLQVCVNSAYKILDTCPLLHFSVWLNHSSTSWKSNST